MQILGLQTKSVREAGRRHTENGEALAKRGKLPSLARKTLASNYPPGITRDIHPEYVKDMYVGFFKSISFIHSGANTRLWHVALSRHEIEIERQARYPQMLRELAQKYPGIIKAGEGEMYTVLQASILTAKSWAEEDNFDVDKEIQRRRTEYVEKYLDKLDHDCLQRQGFKSRNGSKSVRKSSRHVRQVSNFDVEKFDKVQACDEDTFWDILKEKGIRYSWNINLHTCEICEEGPAHEINLNDVNRAIAALIAEGETIKSTPVLKLVQEKQKHEAAVALFKIHLKQYELCRPLIAQVQDNLQPHECIVWRDFVNQHSWDGNKTVNLILVKVFRTEPGGPLQVIKIHNVCTDKRFSASSAFFVADVFDFHFKSGEGSSGHFEGFTTIYICGDHGSHFACLRTFYHESKMWEKYGKVVICLFLCSYHAYNRCDGAGVQLKRLASRAARQGIGPVHAHQYAFLLNNSSHFDSVCHVFEKINEPEDIWPNN